MDSSLFRIGTRDSPLALWQAKKVGALLEAKQINTRFVPTKSEGDLNTTQPIYAMGIQGVFTKALDIALLENKIDLAVHSLKDVPTQLPKGLILAAVLERGSVADVLVQTHKTPLENQATIATGSLRRKAQWLHRYPQHHMVDLRGNVQTRMDKLFSSNWEGAIFAKAGLERVELLGSHYHELDWMIPAPAQGAIGVVCRADDNDILESLKKIDHDNTRKCVEIEREFLRILEGGCSAPIGAHVTIQKDHLQFRGGLFSLDGKQALTLVKEVETNASASLAELAAQEILSKGGRELMNTIKYSK